MASTILSLKKLAVAIKGNGDVGDIPGDTIPEVIDQITEAYKAAHPEEPEETE